MLEGIRSLIIEGWDVTALALALGVSVAIAASGLALSARLLPTRLSRT
jgi:hypothetical protein